jgi:hypothetical protein
MLKATGQTVAFTYIAWQAHRLKSLGKPMFDQPEVESAASDAYRTLYPSIAVDVIDGQMAGIATTDA